jgi:LysM repeat protein
VTHTVKSGETVSELSTRYGVSEKQILAANPQLRDPDELSNGIRRFR